MMGNQRRNDGNNKKAGKREDAEDVEVLFPSAKEISQPFERRFVITDFSTEQRKALGKQVVADVPGAVCVARVGVVGLSGLPGEIESELRGFDLARVGMARQFGDSHVIGVASFVFHLREDAAWVLSKDGVECDERLKHDAPFELIQTPHAMEDR
jgi:hypothetical protein